MAGGSPRLSLVSPGLSLVSPNHGRAAGMDPAALKRPRRTHPKLEAGWDTNPSSPRSSSTPPWSSAAPGEAAPNLSRAGARFPREQTQPGSALPTGTWCHNPPVPRRVLGHTGDSPGQVAQPRLAAGPPRGTAAAALPAAQGLARSPRDIFIPAFVLFEAVGSVFSLVNTTLPWPTPAQS